MGVGTKYYETLRELAVRAEGGLLVLSEIPPERPGIRVGCFGCRRQIEGNNGKMVRDASEDARFDIVYFFYDACIERIVLKI